jgi:hypothetical protein
MDKVIIIQKNIFNDLVTNHDILIENLTNIEYVNSADNLLAKLFVINNSIKDIINEIEELNVELDNKHITPSETVKQRIQEHDHTQTIIKPFLPYMCIYSILTQLNNEQVS